MDPPRPPSIGEKAVLQQHYANAQRQQHENHNSGIVFSPPSPSSAGPSSEGTNAPIAVDDHHSPAALRPQTPPPYSGPSTPSAGPSAPSPAPNRPQRYPGLPVLDYRLYRPPLFEPSADHTTIKSTAAHLSANAAALAALVRAQSTVPPKPQIHITGRRGGSNSRTPDFAIKLNLLPLLVPDDPRAQRMDYIRCVGTGEAALRGGDRPAVEPEVGDGGLDEWAARFVADQTGGVKTFTLERVVANLDVGWLEGQIRSLVASTGYKGVVTVTFPVTHAKVVVQNPDKVNRFFTSVTALFAGKRRYEVVKAVWPFATHRMGEPGRRCVVQSEETWWQEWRDPIRYAVATRRHGWVTNEDKLEALMEGLGKGVGAVDWGPEY